MGRYMNQKGIKSVFLIGPNYASGRDQLGGMRDLFQGQVLGQEMTRWPDQLDFSAELSKVAHPARSRSSCFIRVRPAFNL